MIELNWTFFVQIFNFLLLMFILNKILYKPILKVLDERDARIVGGQEKAKKLLEESQGILKSYNDKLYGAKIDAMTVKNTSRKQAVDQANMIIEDARRNAETIVLNVQKEMAE
ncbi:MAG TPA: ATP synthase F0 subunit B, partial [Desulfomonilia bacterium]|nr:ATP synthase F0 subunit B [Desulfomonilia bacterium]